ncbi:MAG: AraC family transcriptional regulator [Clostridiales bacterium]|nr:AraC family transcriptional regulator [Clostridiales bacterium]
MNENLKENVSHGDFIVPFTTYSGKISDDFSLIPMHWHEEMEITYIVDGSAEISINLNPFTAQKGDIIVVNPLTLHSFKKDPKYSHMTWHTMVFNLNMVQSSLTDGCLIKYIAPLLNKNHTLPTILNKNSLGYKEILNTILKLFDIYENKLDFFELELKSQLYHLLFLYYKYNLVIKNNKNENLSSSTTNKIKNIINYINNHINEDMTIEDISNEVNFSQYHFMKFFKKHIGMTCIDFINNTRLEKASILLNTTDKSIMDIALEVGFNNISYFNKLFKQKYKLTPKDFRKIKNTVIT